MRIGLIGGKRDRPPAAAHRLFGMAELAQALAEQAERSRIARIEGEGLMAGAGGVRPAFHVGQHEADIELRLGPVLLRRGDRGELGQRLLQASLIAQHEPEIGVRGGMGGIGLEHGPVLLGGVRQRALVAFQVAEIEEHVRRRRRQRQRAAVARLGILQSSARAERDTEIGVRGRKIGHEFEQPLVKGDRLIQLTRAVMAHGLREEPARGLVGTAGNC